MASANSIYVGNIPWRTTEQEIGDTFANFGYVNTVKIITDQQTGRSKGFGFVEFADASIIPSVIQQMDGYNLNGRHLRVGSATGGGVLQNNRPNGPPMGGHQMGNHMGGHPGMQFQHQNHRPNHMNGPPNMGYPRQQNQGFNNSNMGYPGQNQNNYPQQMNQNMPSSFENNVPGFSSGNNLGESLDNTTPDFISNQNLNERGSHFSSDNMPNLDNILNDVDGNENEQF